MIIIFDTNVIISALLNRNGKPAKLLRMLLTDEQVLCSKALFAEYEQKLHHDKFSKYINPEQIDNYLHALENLLQFFEPKSKITACRDLSDNKLLELAVDGKADFIITGDKDLLDLHPFANIRILTVNEYFNIEEK